VPEAPSASSIVRERRAPWRSLATAVLRTWYRVSGKHRYDAYRLERVHGVPILVLPSVANPKLLRTGAFFASQLEGTVVPRDARVLDLGTGSGVCALFAARRARTVIATDINPEAVRCARVNALLNRLDSRIEARQGDLFEPVAGERFDLVLFNPPFLLGAPRTPREAAWRSPGAARSFAAGLDVHLSPDGSALLLLSSFGDACASFETELERHGFTLTVHATKHFVNEAVTLLRVRRRDRA
jgi:methylase of polypeptide subunit release factors